VDFFLISWVMCEVIIIFFAFSAFSDSPVHFLIYF
jgi:hypothetical protein